MKSIFLKLFSSFLIFSIILILSMVYIINPSFFYNALDYQKNSEKMTQQQILTQLEQLDNTYVNDEQYEMQQLLNIIHEYYKLTSTTNIETLTQFIENDYTFTIIDANNIVVSSTNAHIIGEIFTAPLPELTASMQTFDDRYTFIMQTIGYEEAYLQTIVNTTLKHNTVIRDLVIWNVHDEKTSQLFLENDTLSHVLDQVLTHKKIYTLKVFFEDGTIEKHQFIPYKLDDAQSATQRIIYLKFDNNEILSIVNKNDERLQMMIMISFIIAFMMTVIILKLLYKTIYFAQYDSLTHVFNRASYDERMQQLFKKKRAQPIGLMLIDLDNFKQLNDAQGHAIGDEALIELTNLLKSVTAKKSHVYRFGGDEFAIVFEKICEQQLHDKANELLQGVDQLKQQLPHWKNLSLSIGASMQCEKKPTARMLFEEADKALYASKRQGKACYTFM